MRSLNDNKYLYGLFMSHEHRALHKMWECPLRLSFIDERFELLGGILTLNISYSSMSDRWSISDDQGSQNIFFRTRRGL